jgi:hypothetical protein
VKLNGESCELLRDNGFQKINLVLATIYKNVPDWEGLKNVHHMVQQNINQKSKILSLNVYGQHILSMKTLLSVHDIFSLYIP